MKSTLPRRVSNELATWFRRDPFAPLREEMNELISRFAGDGNTAWFSDVQVPSMDLSENDKQIEVKMDVPGMKSEELQIELQGNTLVVSGEHKEEKETKAKSFHRIERSSGKIYRAVTLPCAVQQGTVDAVCRDGVLTVTLPKVETACSKKIPVKS